MIEYLTEVVWSLLFGALAGGVVGQIARPMVLRKRRERGTWE